MRKGERDDEGCEFRNRPPDRVFQLFHPFTWKRCPGAVRRTALFE